MAWTRGGGTGKRVLLSCFRVVFDYFCFSCCCFCCFCCFLCFCFCLISCYFVSFLVIPCYFILFMWFPVVSYYFLLFLLVHSVSCYVLLFHVIPCYFLLLLAFPLISCYFLLCPCVYLYFLIFPAISVCSSFWGIFKTSVAANVRQPKSKNSIFRKQLAPITPATKEKGQGKLLIVNPNEYFSLLMFNTAA